MTNSCPFQPFAPETLSQPFAFWQYLREHSPVHRIDVPGNNTPTYLVSRQADVKAAALNHEVFSTEVPSTVWRWGQLEPELQAILDRQGFSIVHTIATSDPPRHTHYRQLVGNVFTPRTVNAMKDSIQSSVDEYLDQIPRGEAFDLMCEFAIPLPIALISDVLGLSADQRQRVIRYTDAFVGMVDPTSPPEAARQATEIFAEGQHFLWEHIQQLRAHPQDNILSQLIAAKDEDGQTLNREELLSLCYVMMSGGNETTRNAIALAGYYLARYPDLWQTLKQDRSKVTPFMEELLRLGSPARLNPRVVLTDTELGGVQLARGSIIFLLWGSANRDDSVYPNAEAFDLSRPQISNHETFGRGIHRCIGAPLGKMELKLSIESWLQRYETWEAAVPIETIKEAPLFGFRTFHQLPIIVS